MSAVPCHDTIKSGSNDIDFRMYSHVYETLSATSCTERVDTFLSCLPVPKKSKYAVKLLKYYSVYVLVVVNEYF